MKTCYVAGFLFNNDSNQVVLLKKSRPKWQAGRYNAVGGKVETGESPVQAMRREFHEETGVDIDETSWEPFVEMFNRDWECTFFRAWGDISKCQTQDLEEPVAVFSTNEVKLMTPEQAISNVPWLLGIALNINGGLKLPLKIEYQ